jgi:hypothetical protein
VALGASSLNASDAADNPSASTFSMTAGIWWTVSGVVASFVGGVVAGRLCGTSDDNTARWHGFVAWCTTTLVVFYLLTSAIGGILGGTFNALGSTIGAAGRGAASAASSALQVADGDALKAQAQRLINPNDAQSAQNDIMAYIRASLSGDQGAATAARDRAVDSVSKAANISPDEARNRLQQAEQQARQTAEAAKQKAQQAAEASLSRPRASSASWLWCSGRLLPGSAAASARPSQKRLPFRRDGASDARPGRASREASDCEGVPA